jgi:hypothetical protein
MFFDCLCVEIEHDYRNTCCLHPIHCLSQCIELPGGQDGDVWVGGYCSFQRECAAINISNIDERIDARNLGDISLPLKIAPTFPSIARNCDYAVLSIRAANDEDVFKVEANK